MSRNLKRVPLDFNWSTKQIWKGYINPYHSQQCKSCDQTGYNPETRKISEEWYSFDNVKWIYTSADRRYNDMAHSYHITDIEVEALVKKGRLSDLTGRQMKHFDEKKKSWYKYEDGKQVKCDAPIIPTTDEVNEWNKRGFGHDGINHHICTEVRAKHLGVYGLCEYCNGEGEIWQSDKIRKLSEKWKSFDPPIGEGYQLWEDTSEGSPDSPVFSTLEALCEWCETNATTFANFKASKEKWFEMLNDGFVKEQQGNVIFL